MNEAIKLAIEKGGYKYGHGIDGDYETDGWSYQEIIDDGIQDKLVLDPLFWQALGKALGWKTESYHYRASLDHGGYRNGSEFDGFIYDLQEQEIWRYIAHQYFDLVLTGGDTEKFWKELLNA